MEKPVRTVIDVLRRVSDRHESGYSYVTENGDIQFESFHELYRRANRIAVALIAHGLEKGDRLGMILYESQPFIDTFFGAILAGVVPVPIAPPPARFGQSENSLRHVAPVLSKAQPRLLLTDKNIGPLLDRLKVDFPACPFVTSESLLGEIESRHDCPCLGIVAEDTVFLQFTSGSTSRPKGVRVSHANLVANVEAIARHGLRATPEDYCVSWLPLNHDMGLIGKVLVPMYAGMRGVLFMPPVLFLKRPLSWLHYLARQKATITFAPNFAYNLCNTRAAGKHIEGLDLSSLRIAGCGAEPVRCEVLETFAQVFKPYGLRTEALMPCYGLAEHTLAVAFSPINAGMIVDRVQTEALSLGYAIPVSNAATITPREGVPVASCGRAFPGHSIKIVDKGGRSSGERTVGEILLSGPSSAQGYFEDAKETASTWRDGWLHTGDLGYLADGNLFVCGRAKDLIIVHGRNYHPQDIEWEAAQMQVGRRGNIVAFSFEDPDLGREQVIIVAETKLLVEHHAQLQQTIRSRLIEALSLKVDQVLLVPPHTLPKTTSGKLQRARTRELFRSGKLATTPVR